MSAAVNINAQPTPAMASPLLGILTGPTAPILSDPAHNNILVWTDTTPGGSDTFAIYISSGAGVDSGFTLYGGIGYILTLDLATISQGGSTRYFYVTALKGVVESSPSNHVQANV